MRARRAKVLTTKQADTHPSMLPETRRAERWTARFWALHGPKPRRHPSGGLRRLTKGPRFDKYGQRIPRLMSFTDEERAEWVEEDRYLRSMWTR